MPRAELSSGIELEYETFGDSADPTLLLVCGYTSQMSGWDPGLCAQFAAQGLHVVRYDNRDVGLSSKLTGSVKPMKVLAAILAGEPTPEVPYTLSHMAADGVGLLDHLGVDRAHIAGMSMGGMIVQTMAIEHPDRVASLTSVMSSTGAPRVGARHQRRARHCSPPHLRTVRRSSTRRRTRQSGPPRNTSISTRSECALQPTSTGCSTRRVPAGSSLRSTPAGTDPKRSSRSMSRRW